MKISIKKLKLIFYTREMKRNTGERKVNCVMSHQLKRNVRMFIQYMTAFLLTLCRKTKIDSLIRYQRVNYRLSLETMRVM